MLEATGSSDPDVLYAAKAEFGRRFERQRMRGLLAIIAGLAILAAIALRLLVWPYALAGVALLGLGFWSRTRGVRNLTTIEAAYRRYASQKEAR